MLLEKVANTCCSSGSSLRYCVEWYCDKFAIYCAALCKTIPSFPMLLCLTFTKYEQEREMKMIKSQLISY